MERPPHRLNSQHKNNTVTNLHKWVFGCDIDGTASIHSTRAGFSRNDNQPLDFLSMVRKSLLSEVHVLVF